MENLGMSALRGLMVIASVYGAVSDAATQIPIVGGANSVVADPNAKLAYASNGAGLLTIDLRAGEVTSNFPLASAVERLEDIDPTTGLVALIGFSVAAVGNPSDGQQTTLLFGGALYGAAVAGGYLFAPDFNRRVLSMVPIGGGDPQSVNPYPGATESRGDVAGPCSLAVSPDRGTVAFGDEFHRALHVVRVADRTLRATIALGVPPCGQSMAFLDNSKVVVVGTALEGGIDRGMLAVVDLLAPNAPPKVHHVDALTSVSAFAVINDHTVAVAQRGSDEAEVVTIELTDTAARVKGRRPLREPATDMVVSPDGETILLAGDSGLTVEPLPLPEGASSSGLDGCVQIDGRPIAGARVRVKRGAKAATTVTDEAGCYALSAPGARRGRLTIELPKVR